VAASCRTGRKDRTQLHDALLSRGPIAKTGATLRSVRKKLQGRVRGAAGDLPAEADEWLAAASALLWWCDCNVNSEKRRAGKAPSRLYGTGSWAGGNRGRRAGEAGSWLFPVKGIPAHSPRGASTRKTRAWFNGKPSSRPNGRELALPPGGHPAPWGSVDTPHGSRPYPHPPPSFVAAKADTPQGSSGCCRHE
jgi:hypothetical protein